MRPTVRPDEEVIDVVAHVEQQEVRCPLGSRGTLVLVWLMEAKPFGCGVYTPGSREAGSRTRC